MSVIGPGARVLEIGCGIGNYVSEIQVSAGCFCVGVDPSREMLAKVQVRANRVRTLQGSAERLDLPDGDFDLAFSVDVIHQVVDVDRSRALREMHRVLRDGGTLCTVTDSERVIRERESSYELTDANAYRDKVYSSLLYLPEDAFQRGLARLEADLQGGPILCASRYTLVWGAKPTNACTGG